MPRCHERSLTNSAMPASASRQGALQALDVVGPRRQLRACPGGLTLVWREGALRVVTQGHWRLLEG